MRPAALRKQQRLASTAMDQTWGHVPLGGTSFNSCIDPVARGSDVRWQGGLSLFSEAKRASARDAEYEPASCDQKAWPVGFFALRLSAEKSSCEARLTSAFNATLICASAARVRLLLFEAVQSPGTTRR